MVELKRLLILFLLAIFLTACVNQENDIDNNVDHLNEVENEIEVLPPSKKQMKEPPELIVRSNDTEVVAVLGTYSWYYDNGDGTGTGIEADSGIPPLLVSDQEAPFKAKLGSEISLDFGVEPIECDVYIWDNDDKGRKVAVEDLAFLTDQTGGIVYEIYAKWNQGTAHYAIEINVQ